MSAPEDWAQLRPRLEDGCGIGTTDGEAALISVAISLKRIADAIDGTTLNVDISESLAGLTGKVMDAARGTI